MKKTGLAIVSVLVLLVYAVLIATSVGLAIGFKRQKRQVEVL